MSKEIKYYSNLRIFDKSGSKYIEKRYTLPTLNRQDLEDLMQRIVLQRSAFEDLHIPISRLENIEIQKEDNLFQLVVIEKFEGLDFVDVVDESNFEMYLERMLNDIYKPLLASTNNEILPVGIDTAIRNCVFRIHEGDFCYVDFMPPKVNYRGHLTQEVPEIEGEFYNIRILSHNNRFGVVYMLYINLARRYPSKRRVIASLIEQFLNSIDKRELFSFIEESPFYRLKSNTDAIEIIKNINDWKGLNYLYLREGACIAAQYNQTFAGNIEDFFKLTHHETDPDSIEYGLLPDARFKKAKSELISVLK